MKYSLIILDETTTTTVPRLLASIGYEHNPAALARSLHVTIRKVKKYREDAASDYHLIRMVDGEFQLLELMPLVKTT